MRFAECFFRHISFVSEGGMRYRKFLKFFLGDSAIRCVVGVEAGRPTVSLAI